MFLFQKKIHGRRYWYFGRSARVNGVAKRVWEEFAGTSESLYQKFKSAGELPEVKLKTYQFGKLAAVLAVKI
ncbi:MAG: hypothetical protein CO114_02320 [Euryarchaeota archaeon CG_4_9_14_3_um_filter_38_12]|nr:MAG: hypothetical protein CO114_02320 [Euryarchaeota archaeon CG_4_9_14_3_um_filter_38_12]